MFLHEQSNGGCCWAEQNGTEDDLHQHLRQAHAEELQAVSQHMLRGRAEDAGLSVYLAAIAERCRSSAPIAGASLDRVALKSMADAMAEDKAALCPLLFWPHVYSLRDVVFTMDKYCPSPAGGVLDLHVLW